jgi:hypothetical protein
MGAGAPRVRIGTRSVRSVALRGYFVPSSHPEDPSMNSIIYLVGAVVVIFAILSFFGLR